MERKRPIGSLGDYVWNRLKEFKKMRMEKRRKLFQEAIFKEDGGLYEPMTKRVVGKTKPVKA